MRRGPASISRYLLPAVLCSLLVGLALAADAPARASNPGNRGALPLAQQGPSLPLDDECEPQEDESAAIELDPIALPGSRAGLTATSGGARVPGPHWPTFPDDLRASPAPTYLRRVLIERAGHFLAVARGLRSWIQSQLC